MGTFETKFVVPDLTTQVKYLPISSVVLSNQRQDMNAALATAEKTIRNCWPQTRLVQDNQKLVPSVTRVFKRDQDMFVFLQAYQPDPLTHATVGGQRKLLSRQGEGVRNRAPSDHRRPGRQDQGSADTLQRAAGKLQSGRYTCQVSVLDPQAQKFAFWRAPIVMVQ